MSDNGNQPKLQYTNTQYTSNRLELRVFLYRLLASTSTIAISCYLTRKLTLYSFDSRRPSRPRHCSKGEQLRLHIVLFHGPTVLGMGLDHGLRDLIARWRFYQRFFYRTRRDSRAEAIVSRHSLTTTVLLTESIAQTRNSFINKATWTSCLFDT